ncbi:methylated-DNA--[protein]-cysteine S-methyltransferase [Acidiferrimicrobium sp. IK]|uniref:methylated-DNA--[protein]-cysteine S-methyltransferase n=1 Tax=Acidiferrimicrobium sp. IK TaxID=2871700 RepID=UPI0021CB20DD|nr:methylated-DNA--[protein]-cysteine S-methyltransferase [Acidiferrimicrobium sp. IK]MCU4185304.1 methylated-DNA--[protein]-cysteine S-methyltransferase [Acidiferrimicrobium sp. IK]
MRARNHTDIDSPIGRLTLVAEDGEICGLYMDLQRHRPAESTLGAPAERGLEAAIEQLQEYFAGERQEFDLVLRPAGSAFHRQVWTALRAIPYGATESYGELAARIGRPGAARAVGLANGRNPISIIVPCHRVIGADGSLTGYGGGVERKRALLDFERTTSGVGAPTLFVS